MANQSSPSDAVEAGASPLSFAAESSLQWNASAGVCHAPRSHAIPAPPFFFYAKGAPVIGSLLSPYWTTREIGFADGVSPQTIAWEQEGGHTMFSLAPILLTNTRHSALSGVTGELIWVPWSEQVPSGHPAVRPVLRVHVLHSAAPAAYLTIVPAFPTADPLLRHITLVLQTAVEGESEIGQLYTQSLTDALAVHFLRRYNLTQAPLNESSGGLSPYKLRRTTAYINAHLEQQLSLSTLAAVGETSPAHFSRLFKQATGLAPHQYVIRCRMERAKHLLAETSITLSEIALLVGCTDHSHFSALFRTHVAQTPTAYRDHARKSFTLIHC